MQKMITSVVVSVLLGSFTVAAAQLPPELQERPTTLTSLKDYLAKLELSGPPTGMPDLRGADRLLRDGLISNDLQMAIDGGSLISFVQNVSAAQKTDILMSMLFAQLAANKAHNRFTEAENWYHKYTEVLTNLGWLVDQFVFIGKLNEQNRFRMDAAALEVIKAVASLRGLSMLTEGLKALESLESDKKQFAIFDFNTSSEGLGNFQLGIAEVAENGAVSLSMGGFYFKSVDRQKRFLFFSWSSRKVNFWAAAQSMTLNEELYSKLRETVAGRLATTAEYYIDSLPLELSTNRD